MPPLRCTSPSCTRAHSPSHQVFTVAHTFVILQKVRQSTWGTRQAAGNRPHTSLRSSSRPLNQAKRRSNLSSLAASPLMLKMVCRTHTHSDSKWASHPAVDGRECTGAEQHVDARSARSHTHKHAPGGLRRTSRNDVAHCESAAGVAPRSQESYLIHRHLPLTQPIHELVPHLQGGIACNKREQVFACDDTQTGARRRMLPACVFPAHSKLAHSTSFVPAKPTLGPSALTTMQADASRSVLSADSCTSEGPSSSLKSSSTESCSARCRSQAGQRRAHSSVRTPLLTDNCLCQRASRRAA